jgi:hypothetical protein
MEALGVNPKLGQRNNNNLMHNHNKFGENSSIEDDD